MLLLLSFLHVIIPFFNNAIRSFKEEYFCTTIISFCSKVLIKTGIKTSKIDNLVSYPSWDEFYPKCIFDLDLAVLLASSL
jgi:hypothetical protein